MHTKDQPLEGWDLFISHASEDKNVLAKPLSAALSAFGLRVWYDEFTLTLGDSLSRSIDKGLASSKYGAVILSPAFFAKRWPEYELRGLTARELGEEKVILPIWHNVTRTDVLQFSPPLADKFALLSSGKTPLELAISLIEVIRPEIFTRIHRRLTYLLALKNGESELIEPARVRPGPIRHKQLSAELTGRIRLVRAALLGVHTDSMENWVDGFRHDAHPSTEVGVWERIAAVVLEYAAMAPLQAAQLPQVFRVVMGLNCGSSRERVEKEAEGLPSDAVEVISTLYRHSLPAYEVDVPRMYPDSKDGEAPPFTTEDREHFPDDLPDDLLESLIRETTDKPMSPKKRSPRTGKASRPTRSHD
jgi:hypothetical protein